MNAAKSKRRTEQRRYEDYNAFVRQIEIIDVSIVSAKADKLDVAYFPDSPKVNWRSVVSYNNRQEVFDVLQRYNVTISEPETKESKAKLAVVFKVTYSSKIPMNAEFFEMFKENIFLNTWPYFREFIHNTLGRMGWPPLIAPTYKT